MRNIFFIIALSISTNICAQQYGRCKENIGFSLYGSTRDDFKGVKHNMAGIEVIKQHNNFIYYSAFIQSKQIDLSKENTFKQNASFGLTTDFNLKSFMLMDLKKTRTFCKMLTLDIRPGVSIEKDFYQLLNPGTHIQPYVKFAFNYERSGMNRKLKSTDNRIELTLYGSKQYFAPDQRYYLGLKAAYVFHKYKVYKIANMF